MSKDFLLAGSKTCSDQLQTDTSGPVPSWELETLHTVLGGIRGEGGPQSCLNLQVYCETLPASPLRKASLYDLPVLGVQAGFTPTTSCDQTQRSVG